MSALDLDRRTPSDWLRSGHWSVRDVARRSALRRSSSWSRHLLRLFQLGRLSFWYDEVVTMRLARRRIRPLCRTPVSDRRDPGAAASAVAAGLDQGFWLVGSGRTLIERCLRIATIVLIYEIGRVAFDTATGLWAAWLAALSPLLIVYAREARMYAWLVLVTCLCWRLLLGLRDTYTTARAVAYVVSLTALVYSHPLGLLMLGTLALAGLIDLEACFGGLKRWLVIHLGAVVLCLPWIGNYLDHPPEFFSGALSLRFLLGTPIGFVGGNFLVMLGLVCLIAFGIARRGLVRDQEGRLAPRSASGGGVRILARVADRAADCALLYSWVSYPVFGPARYTVFVAPAYLVLVASGLSRIPDGRGIRWPCA